MLNTSGNEDPTPEDARSMKDHIEVIQGQLLLVESLINGLDAEYKKFLAAHPA
jgi:hypothetical protein